MAFLGYSARILVSSDTVEKSVRAWIALGFEIEGESNGRVRLTDGQLLLTIMPDHSTSPTLAYFNTDVERLFHQCQQKGIYVTNCSDPSDKSVSSIRLSIPECGEMYVHQRSSVTSQVPTKEQNPILGYYDSLVLGVSHLDAVRTWSEQVGYFIQEEWPEPFPQLDVTDGLMVLSFRKMGASRFIVYYADIDNEFHRHVKGICDEAGIGCTTINSTMIKLTLPEGTMIVIVNDSIEERGNV